jgi:ribose transport system ATP-binding protein
MTTTEPPLLEMRGIGKSFPGVVALQDVSLTVRSGQVVALLGENGAGKSTLINVLSGVFPGYDGTILMDGSPVRIHTPTDAQRLGISTIHQELNLVPDMSVADNIWLGREQRAGSGLVNRRSTNASARQLLDRVGLKISPRRLVRQCRVAEQQLIEVAKALSLNTRVLIRDEPTSALADAEVRRLFEVIRSLTADGVAIIYISHRIEELEELADSVNVLRDGRWIGARTMEGTSRDELIRMMVGRSVADLPRRTTDDRPAQAGPRLQVRNLSLQGDAGAGRVALHNIDLDVHPGEIVGLAGLMGAGRTETLESIFGAYPGRAVTGEIMLDGNRYRPPGPRHAIDNGIVLVAEDRKQQSLVLDATVRFNTSLAALGRYLRWGWVRNRAERAAVGAEVKRLGVKTPSINTRIGTLSGGNQQKVVLAKGLLTQPTVILLDEPTRGIDVGAKSEIYELVNELAAQGVSFLVASSELPELLRMSDRILVLCEGRLTAEMDAETADQEQILEAAMARSSVLAGSGGTA